MPKEYVKFFCLIFNFFCTPFKREPIEKLHNSSSSIQQITQAMSSISMCGSNDNSMRQSRHSMSQLNDFMMPPMTPVSKRSAVGATRKISDDITHDHSTPFKSATVRLTPSNDVNDFERREFKIDDILEKCKNVSKRAMLNQISSEGPERKVINDLICLYNDLIVTGDAAIIEKINKLCTVDNNLQVQIECHKISLIAIINALNILGDDKADLIEVNLIFCLALIMMRVTVV